MFSKASTIILLTVAIVFSFQRGIAQRPLGTDVSGYQVANINWTPATNGGVRFAWSKATEGTGYINPNFASQVAGATAAKVYVGAYHYSRPGLHPNIAGTNSADSEAAYFWSTAGPYIKNGGGYLMPMLDWEDVGTSGQPSTEPSIANGFTTAQMSAWVNQWCTTVSNTAYSNGVIVNPVVYSGSWYSAPGAWPGLDSSVTYHPNNMSGYPSNPNPQSGAPSSTSPWPSWTFWQYADTNWTGGDSDVYNGDLNGLIRNFVIGGTNAPSFTTSPASITATPGSSATFSARVSGQAPMSLKWLFNGTVLPGATSSNYSLASVQPANAGAYTIVASNSYATVSATAYLTILSNAPGCILDPPGLVDWWPAENTSADIYGTFHGTPVGNVSYTAGEQGRAFHFDGTTSYLTTAAASIAVPWTACFWVNRQNASGTAAALTGDGSRELKLEQYSNGTNSHQVGFTIFTVADYNFGYTVPQNTWTHLAFVASGTQMQLYANGTLAGTIATNIPLPRAYIGAGYVTGSNARIVDYMLGSLDEILVFNRALSVAEISAIRTAGSAGLVRVPEFTSAPAWGNAQSVLHVRGLTGKTFSIYRSPDMTAWTRIATGLSNPTGAIQFTDPAATNSQNFYRAFQP